MSVALTEVHNLLRAIWFALIIFSTHITRRWVRTPRVTTFTADHSLRSVQPVEVGSYLITPSC